MFRIWKKILRIIAIILPCFLTIFVSQNSFAVSDYTFTYDSSNSSTSPYICGNNSGVDCSDYAYILLQSEDTGIYSSNNSSIAFYMEMNVHSGVVARQYNQFYEMSPRIVITIPANGIRSLQVWTIGPLTRTVTITLTESVIPNAPSGSITLTENGTYDVTSYAEAVVDVPETIVPGDYHDDLTSIRNVIIVCAGVVLVLYFFYCIYGMIIPTTGGKK